MPCIPWGTPTELKGTTVTETGGELVIALPAGTADASGGCFTGQVPFTSAGVFARIDATAPAGITLLGATAVNATIKNAIFAIRDDGAATHGLSVIGTNVSGTGAAYDVGAPLWVRIRPDAPGTGTLFETSTDGLDWMTVGTGTDPPPAMVQISVEASTLTAAAAPGTARFASVNTCPQ